MNPLIEEKYIVLTHQIISSYLNMALICFREKLIRQRFQTDANVQIVIIPKIGLLKIQDNDCIGSRSIPRTGFVDEPSISQGLAESLLKVVFFNHRFL